VNIYTCVYMQLYNFRDGHVTTFRHPICQMPGHRLSGLRHTIRVSAFHRYRWFGLKLFPYAVHRIVEGYPKTRKTLFLLFLDLAPPTLQNSGMFHDITRPHLHFDGLPPKSRRSVVSDLGCITSITKTSFWFGLEPLIPRSRSKSAHKCIPYNNRCVQNFMQIG